MLYDNLIEDFPPDQVRSVVAHELGHVENRDIPKGILWIAIVAPAGTFLVQRLAERFAGGGLPGRGRQARRQGAARGGAGARARELRAHLRRERAVAPGGGARRRLRAGADEGPEAFIALERSLALRNLGDPDPPRLTQLLFGTHPTTRGAARVRGGRGGSR